jgi:hypothetical protein
MKTTGGYDVQLVALDRLRNHEEHDAEYAAQLAERIRADGGVLHPVVVAQGSMTLLDGHHRVAALRHLGARYAPCVVLDYRDPRIIVDSWRADISVCRSSVLHAAVSRALLPPKTSRHRFKPELGEMAVTLETLLAH